jgi:phage terminase Nu1 subunit (DNA packaging protein)
MLLDLSKPCTQAEFGQAVGITRRSVTDLQADGVIKKGDTAGQWLTAYVTHLREGAAGRSGGENLSKERALQARVARERDEIRLAVDRQEYAPVAVLEQALATLGARNVSALQPLHLKLQKRCPGLSPAGVALIQAEVAKACAAAEKSSLAALVPKDETAEDEGSPD